jgi:hypothetical protein
VQDALGFAEPLLVLVHHEHGASDACQDGCAVAGGATDQQHAVIRPDGGGLQELAEDQGLDQVASASERNVLVAIRHPFEGRRQECFARHRPHGLQQPLVLDGTRPELGLHHEVTARSVIDHACLPVHADRAEQGRARPVHSKPVTVLSMRLNPACPSARLTATTLMPTTQPAWPDSKVVMQRTANPLFGGSIPPPASTIPVDPALEHVVGPPHGPGGCCSISVERSAGSEGRNGEPGAVPDLSEDLVVA